MYVRGTGNNSNLHAAQLPTYMYAVVEVGACGVDISGTCLRTYEWFLPLFSFYNT